MSTLYQRWGLSLGDACSSLPEKALIAKIGRRNFISTHIHKSQSIALSLQCILKVESKPSTSVPYIFLEISIILSPPPTLNWTASGELEFEILSCRENPFEHGGFI